MFDDIIKTYVFKVGLESFIVTCSQEFLPILKRELNIPDLSEPYIIDAPSILKVRSIDLQPPEQIRIKLNFED